MYSNELYHHGVLGMKWGVRRYQSYATKPRASGEGGKEIGAAKRNSIISKQQSQGGPPKGTIYEYDKPKVPKWTLEENPRREQPKSTKNVKSSGSKSRYRTSGQKYVEKVLKTAGTSLASAAAAEVGKQVVKLIFQKVILKA